MDLSTKNSSLDERLLNYRKLDSVSLKNVVIQKSETKFFVKALLDRFIFFRWSFTGYFNQIDANLRLFSSFVTTCWIILLFSLIYYLFFSALDAQGWLNHQNKTAGSREIAALTIFFLGTWTGVYWREKSSMYKKWHYLASLYNDYLKGNPTDKEKFNERKLLAVSLCIDILQMNMWSHRSFKTIFKYTLAEAIQFYFDGIGNDEQIYREFSKICSGELTYTEAKNLLSNYQRQCFHSDDLPIDVLKLDIAAA